MGGPLGIRAAVVTRRVMPEAVQIASPGLDRTDRERWLEIRRAGIGGSDMAAILGLDAYKTALDIYFDKRGEGEARRGPALEEAARFGHLMEGVIAKEFAVRSGLRLLRPPGVMANVSRPFMLATVDWLVTDVLSGKVPPERKYPLEVKTRSVYQSVQWKDSPADAPAIQTHWYTGVTGAPKGYIAALIGGNQLKWYEVPRDDDLIGMLIEAAESFRKNHLDTGVPPEPGGTPQASTLLDSIWGGDPEKFVYLDRGLTVAREEAVTAAAAVKAAMVRMETARNRVKLAMGDAEVAFAGGNVFATWTRNGTFAWKRFMREEPELAEQYQRGYYGINAKRLAEDHPEKYREYCARVLRFPGADDEEEGT